jgi:hypothetical protein
VAGIQNLSAPEIPITVSYETVAAEEEARSRNWVVPGDHSESGASYEVAEVDSMLAEHIVNEIESQNGFIPESEESSYLAQDVSAEDSDIVYSEGKNMEIEEIKPDRAGTNFHMELRSSRA